MNSDLSEKMVRLHDLLDYEILQFNAGENQLKNAIKKWTLGSIPPAPLDKGGAGRRGDLIVFE